jgi:hydrogenase expression/formation protein HypC
MCITTPGRVVKIDGNRAVVDINGRFSEVRIDLVKVAVGDYIYCASGMAVEKADLTEVEG